MDKDKVGLGALSLSKYISSFTVWICYSNIHLSYRQTGGGIAQGHFKGNLPSILDLEDSAYEIKEM